MKTKVGRHMKESEKIEATETDAATMSLAIAICDSLIESNLLSPEILLKKLDVARIALQSEKYPTAAGIVGTVHAALSDQEAMEKRRHLAEILTSPARGGTQ